MATKKVPTMDAVKTYVRKNATPVWQSDVTYAQYAIVFSALGNIFKSKAAGNLNHDPDEDVDETYWEPAGGGGSTLVKYTAGEAASKGQAACLYNGKVWKANCLTELESNVVGFFSRDIDADADVYVQKIGELKNLTPTDLKDTSLASYPSGTRYFTFEGSDYTDQLTVDDWTTKSGLEFATELGIIGSKGLRSSSTSSNGTLAKSASSYLSFFGNWNVSVFFKQEAVVAPGSNTLMMSIVYNTILTLKFYLSTAGKVYYQLKNETTSEVYDELTAATGVTMNAEGVFLGVSYSSSNDELNICIDNTTFTATLSEAGNFMTDLTALGVGACALTFIAAAASGTRLFGFDQVVIHEAGALTLEDLVAEYVNFAPWVVTGAPLFLGPVDGTIIQDQTLLESDQYRVFLGYGKLATSIDIQVGESVLLSYSEEYYDTLPIGFVAFDSTLSVRPNFAQPLGQAISRTTYADLNARFSALGYPYGSGDGATTFNLPYYDDPTARIKLFGSTLALEIDTFSYLMKGKKDGLDLYYSASNTLKLRVGACHINDGVSNYWVTKDAETTIDTSSLGNGSGRYVCIDKDGTITIELATVTSSTRPSDTFFQWREAGGTGFNHSKQGYYFSSTKRIIGFFWKASSTSFFLIQMRNGSDEEGENAYGSWKREGNEQTVKARNAALYTTSNTIGSLYYINTDINYPVAFLNTNYLCVPTAEYASGAVWIGSANKATSVVSVALLSVSNSYTGYGNALCKGQWHA